MSGRPLTACPSPTLDWSRPESPASKDFDDIYFSVDNGLEETQAVFLAGCGLPHRWQNRDHFVIGELGFGTGLNFLTAWQLWQQTKPNNGHLHFISTEKFPLKSTDLARALSAWPELAQKIARLLALWPGSVKGFHRLHIAPDVTLTLCFMDTLEALMALHAGVDAWFLDGFSPAKNSDMWSPEIMQAVARLSKPEARLGTFTVASFVRQGLTDAGFTVEKKPGFGRKRHRLEAIFKGDTNPKKTKPIRPIIIGGGIAGASLAKAFARRNIQATLIDDDQIAASGNPAAIVKPRLDLQDRPESRFFLASYLYALGQYLETDAVIAQGVTQYVQSNKDHDRYVKLAKQAPLPVSHLSYETKARIITFNKALVIDPKIVIQDWTSNATLISGTVSDIRKSGDHWQVIDGSGHSLATGSHVIIAAGYGTRKLIQPEDFGIRYTRGQLTWAQSHAGITETMSYGGYAIPLTDGLLLGATNGHVTSETSNPFAILPDDDAENIDALNQAMRISAKQTGKPSRAAVRVVTNDTLPKYDEISPGQWVMTGLGSRGFVFAPLLGEAIVSEICDEPFPLNRAIRARFGHV